LLNLKQLDITYFSQTTNKRMYFRLRRFFEVCFKYEATPSMKLHSKNFKDYSSDLCQKKRNDMTIPGICVFKSTHGGKKELFNILLFLKGKLSLFLRVFGGFFP